MEKSLAKKPRKVPAKPSGEKSSGNSRLPSEIILSEILPWLPVRAILKFRRVCKEWHLFISGGNRGLAIQQFQRHQAASIGGIYTWGGYYKKLVYHSFFDNTLTVLSTSSPNRFYITDMGASTNGLLCLICLEDKMKSKDRFAYIFNPFMKKIGDRVPLIHGDGFGYIYGSKTIAVGSAFDPTASDYMYKLVQFDFTWSNNRNNQWEVRFFVYSSHSKSWVMSGCRTTCILDPSCQTSWPVFYAGGGKFYWHNECVLVHYNMEEDVAGFMAMPELPAVERNVMHQELMAFRGGPLFCTRMLWNSGCVEVWELTEKQTWECKLKVESSYEIMETGLQMERLIGLKGDDDFEWQPRRAFIYEEEDDGRRRLFLKFFFTCRVRHSLYFGALDYNLETKRVIRRRSKCRLIRKTKHPSCEWSVSPYCDMITIHRTMLDVPT